MRSDKTNALPGRLCRATVVFCIAVDISELFDLADPLDYGNIVSGICIFDADQQSFIPAAVASGFMLRLGKGIRGWRNERVASPGSPSERLAAKERHRTQR